MCSTKTIRRFLQRLDKASLIFSVKATGEIRDAEWDTDWAREIIRSLHEEDFERCEASEAIPGDTLWVFCPEVATGTLWIRLVEHYAVIVVSFHPAGEP